MEIEATEQLCYQCKCIVEAGIEKEDEIYCIACAEEYEILEGGLKCHKKY